MSIVQCWYLLISSQKKDKAVRVDSRPIPRKKRISFIDVLNLIHFLQVCHHEFPFLGMVCKNNLARFTHWIFIYRHSLAAIKY